MASEWNEFEQHVWSGCWARRFPRKKGWTREKQKRLRNGSIIVDFAAWRGNERAVGDAKDKSVLTADDVSKLIRDAGTFKASDLYVFVANDTQVPDSVRDYADDKGVTIIRTKWRA